MAQDDGVQVLVVDDEHATVRTMETLLRRQGWTVTTARDGLEAMAKLDHQSFDVILCDIHMPGYGGLQFLRNVRDRGLDVPVVLMTEKPSVDSCIRAIEHGVFRYLIKPVSNDKLVEVVRHGLRANRLGRLKQQASQLQNVSEPPSSIDDSTLDPRLSSALRHLWMAYQPIVKWSDRSVFGYEALLRSDEPTLTSPADILAAAERCGRVQELGRAVREKVANAIFATPAIGPLFFVNLHSSDLNDDDLFAEHSPLSRVAKRVVLEVTERASLDGVKDSNSRASALRSCGFRLAIDDLGAGYAGLSSVTLLEPSIVKVDMSLVRGIDTDPKRQSVLRSIIGMCSELDIVVVVEGVETARERDKLLDLGCDYLQGYLFAKPARGFPTPIW